MTFVGTDAVVARPLGGCLVGGAGCSEGFRASCPVLACHLRGAASEPPTHNLKRQLCVGGSEVQVAGQDRAREEEGWMGEEVEESCDVGTQSGCGQGGGSGDVI